MMLVLTVVLFEKGGTAIRQLLDPGSAQIENSRRGCPVRDSCK